MTSKDFQEETCMHWMSAVILALSISVNAQLQDSDLQDYLDVDTGSGNSVLIDAVASSVCQLRASKHETVLSIIDPRDEMNGNSRFIDKIVESEEDRFYCSAIVINDNTFLTASHCNQANIERTIRFGKMEFHGAKYTKDSSGKIYFERNLECEKKSNQQKLECKPLLVKVRMDTRLNDVYLTCHPGKSNEVRIKAPSTRGWPNPRFSASRGNYDTTVWRTAANIDTSVPRAPFLTQEDDIAYSFTKFGKSCKTIGFGPMEVGDPNAKPTFKILHTPITGFNKDLVASTFGDYLRPGDSGGGLFCLGKDKKYNLVGINSRIYYYQSGVNVFSLNSFNGEWINYILNDESVPLEHEGPFYSGSPLIFHKVALKYELSHMKSRLTVLEKCVKSVRGKNDNLGYGPELRKNLKLMKNESKKVAKIFKRKKEIDVVVRSHLFVLFDKLEKSIDACLMVNPKGLEMDYEEQTQF